MFAVGAALNTKLCCAIITNLFILFAISSSMLLFDNKRFALISSNCFCSFIALLTFVFVFRRTSCAFWINLWTNSLCLWVISLNCFSFSSASFSFLEEASYFSVVAPSFNKRICSLNVLVSDSCSKLWSLLVAFCSNVLIFCIVFALIVWISSFLLALSFSSSNLLFSSSNLLYFSISIWRLESSLNVPRFVDAFDSNSLLVLVTASFETTLFITLLFITLLITPLIMLLLTIFLWSTSMFLVFNSCSSFSSDILILISVLVFNNASFAIWINSLVFSIFLFFKSFSFLSFSISSLNTFWFFSSYSLLRFCNSSLTLSWIFCSAFIFSTDVFFMVLISFIAMPCSFSIRLVIPSFCFVSIACLSLINSGSTQSYTALIPNNTSNTASI